MTFYDRHEWNNWAEKVEEKFGATLTLIPQMEAENL